MTGSFRFGRRLVALAASAFALMTSSAMAADPPLALEGPVAVTKESGEPFRGTNA